MSETMKIDAPLIMPGEIYKFKTPFGETGKWICIDVTQAKVGKDIYDYLGITNIPPMEPSPPEISEFKVGDDTFYYENENVMYFRSLRYANIEGRASADNMERFYQLNWKRRYYNYMVDRIKACADEIILGQIYDFYNNGSEEPSCQVVFVKQTGPGKINGFILLETEGELVYYNPGVYELNLVQNNLASGTFKPAGFLNPDSFMKLSLMHDITSCGFFRKDEFTIDMHELVEKSRAEKAAREQEEAIKNAVEAANSKHEVTTHVENDEQPKPKKKRTSKKKEKKDA